MVRLGALVEKWQRSDNLVAPNTVPTLWHRHIADSAQLMALFPQVRRWLDLGSGGGFPGLVLACLGADTQESVTHLVESNVRKCAFLRTVARELDVPAIVHQDRIETVLRDWDEPVDMITARALAPLDKLLDLAEPVMKTGVPAAFFKGADYRNEIKAASDGWTLDLVEYPSRIIEDGRILEIRSAKRKALHPTNHGRTA